MSILLLLSLLLNPPQPKIPYYGMSEELFRLTNLQREVPLIEDECLKQKSYYRAEKMYKDGYFSHTDPATSKTPYSEMVFSCDSKFMYAGENLAIGFKDVNSMSEALTKSPTHKKNIVNPKYSKVGINCYLSLCVEFFAGEK